MGRNMTGPPRAAPWWVTLHRCRVTDDRRGRQKPAIITSLPPNYTMCRRASNNSQFISHHQLIISISHNMQLFTAMPLDSSTCISRAPVKNWRISTVCMHFPMATNAFGLERRCQILLNGVANTVSMSSICTYSDF